jgi:hypothetical protein
MLIVGELINASRKSVRAVIEKKDAEGWRTSTWTRWFSRSQPDCRPY